MKLGFTLVELLICVAIFVVITSVAVWNNNAFNSSILLTDLAYEVALSVRQAQVYGITVKAPAACSGGSQCNFSSGYGVDFNTSGTVNMSSSTNYVLFEDVASGGVNSHIYNGIGELVSNFSIGRGYSVKWLCVSGYLSHINDIDISFLRPEPEAYLSVNGTLDTGAEADIFVQAPSGGTQREIIVEPTGQISVKIGSASCQ